MTTTTITIEISGPPAEKLRHLVESERRSEAEIVGDALEAYATAKRRLPRGVGKYRSDPTVAPSTGRKTGAGFLRTEGALADDTEWDAIMAEIYQDRKRDRRPPFPDLGEP